MQARARVSTINMIREAEQKYCSRMFLRVEKIFYELVVDHEKMIEFSAAKHLDLLIDSVVDDADDCVRNSERCLEVDDDNNDDTDHHCSDDDNSEFQNEIFFNLQNHQPELISDGVDCWVQRRTLCIQTHICLG